MQSSVAVPNAVNFFMTDVRDGLGLYLGVFLQKEKWPPGKIGAVMTIQGIGASLSPALGGAVAERFGYSAPFLALGSIAFVALAAWFAATPLVAQACAVPAVRRAIHKPA
jgi:MFS family permease